MTRVEHIDQMIERLEEAKGARCPIRTVPIDMVADAVEREQTQSPSLSTQDALFIVLTRYCHEYLPPRSEAIDVFGIYHIGGSMTMAQVSRDGE